MIVRPRRRVQRHHRDRLVGAFWRIAADADTTRNGKAQQRLRHLVDCDEVIGKAAQGIGRIWQSNLQEFRTFLEPFNMLRPAEWSPIEDTHDFEKAIPVQETAIEHRNYGLFFADELSV